MNNEFYSFPLSFIDRCVKKFLDKLFVKNISSKPASSKKEVLICTEFLGKISIQMKKKLQHIFRECGQGIKQQVSLVVEGSPCHRDIETYHHVQCAKVFTAPFIAYPSFMIADLYGDANQKGLPSIS